MTRADSAGPEDANAGWGHESSGGPSTRLLLPLDTGLTRLGIRGPFRRDLALGVFVALVSLGILVSLQTVAWSVGMEFAPTSLAVLAVLTCAQSLVLCVRRSRPLLCLSAVVAAQVGILALLPADVAFQGLASFFAAYTCGAVLSLRRLLWVMAAVVALLGVCGVVFALPPFTALSPPVEVGDPLIAGIGRALSAVFSYGVVGFIGSDVATRRRFARLERLREAEAQRERTNSAIRAERTRMARELHDIAAHHLSGMVVQAGAAEQLIGRDDRAAAEMTAWVRSQGKETLDSLRMVVGTLREPGEHPPGTSEADEGEAEGAPVPGIAVLDRLVAGERALGSEVTLERTGGAYDLPPVADVTFYRVAQEALANARDHAWGARVRVELDYRESEVVLQVENEPGVERAESPADSRGMGLAGMKERAELIGAVLEAGLTDSGGWRVRLTLSVT
ncbi:signal transduction histidine kinase [Lipingzhangella halophila]|uniref:histidine kinase n=1 Tax=Lipingzhangella halophila TaxID=1783352 RepID=A0A7W7W1A8_9ACTN|nr:histidine kinase [Lipingzhangella halophila]MBB4929505.1 signal transduction histidine kinase [Lipingzhangella halophila]